MPRPQPTLLNLKLPSTTSGSNKKRRKAILGESSDVKKLPKSNIASAEHSTSFDVPLYNIWTQQEIADDVGLTKDAITKICIETAGLPKLCKPDQSAAIHATEKLLRNGERESLETILLCGPRVLHKRTPNSPETPSEKSSVSAVGLRKGG